MTTYTAERDQAGSIYWYVRDQNGAAVAAYYSEYAALQDASLRNFRAAQKKAVI